MIVVEKGKTLKCPYCKKIAFKAVRNMFAGNRISVEDVVLGDGSKPDSGIVECYLCKENLGVGLKSNMVGYIYFPHNWE